MTHSRIEKTQSRCIKCKAEPAISVASTRSTNFYEVQYLGKEGAVLGGETSGFSSNTSPEDSHSTQTLLPVPVVARNRGWAVSPAEMPWTKEMIMGGCHGH